MSDDEKQLAENVAQMAELEDKLREVVCAHNVSAVMTVLTTLYVDMCFQLEIPTRVALGMLQQQMKETYEAGEPAVFTMEFGPRIKH